MLPAMSVPMMLLQLRRLLLVLSLSSTALIALNMNSPAIRRAGTVPMQDAPALIVASTANAESSRTVEADRTRYQVAFSTDCGDYQRWQSYLLFYSVMRVDQPGYVTRIASGCTDEEAQFERRWFDQHVRPMSNRFRLHLTPHFSNVYDDNGAEVGESYDYFNKPFGMQHWLEHGEGMGVDPATGTMRDEDVIVILLDPDHILLRPLTEDFSDPAHRFPADADMGQRKVRHGAPFAQEYGFFAQWQRETMEVAEEDSPAKNLTRKEAASFYPAGPPYLATARDFYNIVKKWTEYVPKVHKVHPHLMAEMYAYSLAAAHLQLPHQMVHTLMMSSTDYDREGWSMIDDLPLEEACQFGFDIYKTDRPLPGVMHYCQRYMIGKHFFGKRRLPTNFLTCEKALLYEPPADVGGRYNYKIPPPPPGKPPGSPPGEKQPLSEMQQRRDSLAICLITRTLNEAAAFYKKNACEEGTANLSKRLDLWTV